jgi:hypothetical protein
MMRAILLWRARRAAQARLAASLLASGVLS